jgi:sulfatase modifying factor 1
MDMHVTSDPLVEVIEIEGTHRPYKVARDVDNLKQNDVFVRHGSYVRPASPEEIIEMRTERKEWPPWSWKLIVGVLLVAIVSIIALVLMSKRGTKQATSVILGDEQVRVVLESIATLQAGDINTGPTATAAAREMASLMDTRQALEVERHRLQVTLTSEALEARSPSPSPKYTPTAVPSTPTPTPTETSQPTSTPTCPGVTGPFAAAWRSVQGVIGCAIDQIVVGLAVEENFEDGKMLWREWVDYAQALVLFNDGTWQIVEHSPYIEGSSEFSCPDANTLLECPPTPKRGFGMIWCDSPEIRSRLGNATDCERGYQGLMQQFEQGFMLLSDSGTIFILRDDGHWEQWSNPRSGITIVYIPVGDFRMGSEIGESGERPMHWVHLAGFWIEQFEVTNAAFERFVLETGYQTDAEQAGWGYVWQNRQWDRIDGLNWRHPNHPGERISAIMDHPVVQVSWYDAKVYCQWIGGRLPTEAEWEMAAIGTTGWKYPWGNEFDPTRLNASGSGTVRVGSYEMGKSPLGAYDMAGNVWEWVSDWYREDYYASSPSTNPPGPIEGDHKALRGGGWDPSGGDSRSADRGFLGPSRQGNTIGFRCAWGP